MDLELRNKLVKGYIWSIALCGAENLDASSSRSEKPGKFEMWCCKRMEQSSSADHVRNEEVLLRVQEQRNILREISKRKLTGLVTFCVETASYNRLLKER
jgi:hypothetical protein